MSKGGDVYQVFITLGGNNFIGFYIWYVVLGEFVEGISGSILQGFRNSE